MLTKNQILSVINKKKKSLKQVGVNKIGLFGSYSKQLQNETSDVDILIDFYPEQETFDNLMAVYDILEKAFENYKVDIITTSGLSKNIGPYILKEVQYA